MISKGNKFTLRLFVLGIFLKIFKIFFPINAVKLLSLLRRITNKLRFILRTNTPWEAAIMGGREMGAISLSIFISQNDISFVDFSEAFTGNSRRHILLGNYLQIRNRGAIFG